MKITRAVVPSLFTVLNMFCGFLSIVQSSEGHFDFAAWFILLGGVFDSLDGMMARITKSTSEFGVEFDSLSDVVSFGAAPAFMVYKLNLFHLEGFGVLISSLLLLMGGIRLARFNVQLVGFDKEYFNGLPIPASAITIVAFVLSFRNETVGLTGYPEMILPYLVTALALLMVSKVKYDPLPKPHMKEVKKHPWRVITFCAFALILIFTKGQALFYLCLAYILIGLVRYLWKFASKLTGSLNEKSSEETEEVTSYDV